MKAPITRQRSKNNLLIMMSLHKPSVPVEQTALSTSELQLNDFDQEPDEHVHST